MSKIVNLRTARKRKARGAAKEQADANAVRFGRTKGAKARDLAEAEKTQKDLDGKKLDED